jgi:biopolymer transport protein ExbD
MRRFSRRSALVTLSEINITPLLDLAFVLLIIFVITTPFLEQGMPLRLPKGGQPDRPIDPHDIRTIEISNNGTYMLNRTRMSLDQVQSALMRDAKANPNLVIYIRADENSAAKYVYAVIDFCRHNGLTRMDLRTDPPKR